jgi:lysyl-tRNA synthetase class 2
MMRDKIIARAKMLDTIRAFFSTRGVMEVETPLLCSFSVTDIHMDSFRVDDRFLQTSPEYAMKRLLAENSGPIFQMCKSFRRDEAGKKHNPEFSMLEWYRPGFNHHQLMDEVNALFIETLACGEALRLSYQDIFKTHLLFDPFEENTEKLREMVSDKNFVSPPLIPNLSREDLLDLLFTHFIEPFLGLENSPVFVYDFPVEQAALAKIRHDHPPVGERFEVYMNGVELANGFHELTNAQEQLQRFSNDQKKRAAENKFIPDIDHYFIEALKKGLPDCSGVALGLDRLLMLKMGTHNIKDVLCFPWEII